MRNKASEGTLEPAGRLMDSVRTQGPFPVSLPLRVLTAEAGVALAALAAERAGKLPTNAVDSPS
jgi:hypothetical protein